MHNPEGWGLFPSKVNEYSTLLWQPDHQGAFMDSIKEKGKRENVAN